MRRHRIKPAIALVVLIGIGALVWHPILQASAVAAVTKGVPEGYPPYFDGGAPSAFMTWVDSAILEIVNRCPRAVSTRGKEMNDKFRAFFRPPINYVVITLPFKGDPGAVLSRFSHLHKLIVLEANRGASEEEWRRLGAGLHSCRRLHEIQFFSPTLSDAAIAPLSGQGSIRTVIINLGHLTPDCACTFAALPQLATLSISEQVRNKVDTLSPKDLSTMSAALPKVTLDLR